MFKNIDRKGIDNTNTLSTLSEPSPLSPLSMSLPGQLLPVVVSPGPTTETNKTWFNHRI